MCYASMHLNTDSNVQVSCSVDNVSLSELFTICKDMLYRLQANDLRWTSVVASVDAMFGRQKVDTSCENELRPWDALCFWNQNTLLRLNAFDTLYCRHFTRKSILGSAVGKLHSEIVFIGTYGSKSVLHHANASNVTNHSCKRGEREANTLYNFLTLRIRLNHTRFATYTKAWLSLHVSKIL